MIARIALSLVVAVLVGLGVILLGIVLSSLGVEIAAKVGDFLRSWGQVIGVAAGVWYFFSRGPITLP